MPATQTGKILVTGANGYIGLWVVDALLKQNYSVRSAVRSASKAAELQTLFGSYGTKHETAIVEDITSPGAFDESVKGVDGIVHLASPFHMHAKTPSELIDPAVGGAVGVLTSAFKCGHTVKRVVLTSSTASISQSSPGNHVLSEVDWTDSVKIVEEQGDKASPFIMYRASKSLAEQAAWKFVREHKPQWDLVTACPPYVFGPLFPGSSATLGSSMEDWYNTVVKGTKTADTLANVGAAWIDVRDAARAHVLALQKEEAGNERILIVTGHYKFQDWVNSARKFDPELPKGNESYKPEEAVHQTIFKSDKAARLLGLTNLLSMDQTSQDTLEDLKSRQLL
ncbi:hypothetical protein EW026_g7151 [Hermanssonia centrifuga]|uniref:NAD-dependent epimerase/dehydratase domain-containing protein n=1 Tax=Hermanssonia centrifuga TaxID=98765 RepID=A0A4S4K8U4_9APHY|nr:hypothetical protein EW026_g7151 [Hermanssonia centrifuga]